jgi:hypothetical protein
LSWFEEAHKGVPREFPPPLKIESDKTYVVTFLQPAARIVPGGFGRKAPVIVVECEGKKWSLYLSHVDLDRQVANLHDKLGSLEGIVVGIIRKKTGATRGYRYEVDQITKKASKSPKA